MAELATAGLDSIAVRVPDHPVARDILRRLGRPVVAPSANRSGHVSPTTAQHVLADLGGRIDLIVDGGPTPVGVESTIVACLDGPVLLRPGGLPREEIERVLGAPLDDAPASAVDPEAPIAPGMLASHYAPRARLRLRRATTSARARRCSPSARSCRPAPSTPRWCSTCRRPAIWSRPPPTCFPTCARSTPSGVATIAVMPVPHEGLGEAINDRLARAAAPRDGR